mgnify:CR=1 FL=1
MDEKQFEIILGIEKLIHKIIESPLQALNLTVSTAPFFSLFQFSEGFFSFVLEKVFGLENMSPSLDCNGYLNDLVFNFKIIRISQRAGHFFVCVPLF